MSIDKSIKFVSINIGLITVSDTRTLENDKSGNLLNDRINNFGHKIELRKIIKDDVEIKYVHDFSDCVRKAIREATKYDNVLLSPACASFDQFNNFEERGDLFKKIVMDENNV